MKTMSRLLFFLAVNKTYKRFNLKLIYVDVASIVYGYMIVGENKEKQ